MTTLVNNADPVTITVRSQTVLVTQTPGVGPPGPEAPGGDVSSVNGETGVVVLTAADVGAATTAQGATADSAVQPGDLATVATTGAYADLIGEPTLATVATTGAYADLSGKPTLGTAAATAAADYATAAQGAKADTAVQPADLTAYATDADITALIGAAPAALNTLSELADAINDDASYAATVTTALAGKQPLATVLTNTTASFTTADETKLDGIEALADVTDATNVNAAGAVMESDYDANTILAATTDNTPVTLTVAASRIVGRKASGDIAAMTLAELVALGGTPDGTKFLKDDGTLAVPAGGSGSVPTPPAVPTLGYGYLDGAGQVAAGSTLLLVANTLYYDNFMWAPWDVTITAVELEVTTNVNPSTIRIGLVSIDPTDGQPLALLGDLGTVNSSANGVKTITSLSVAVAGGTLVSLVFISGHAPTVRTVPVAPLFATYNTINPYSSFQHATVASQAAQHTALSNPPTDWTTIVGSNAVANRKIKMKWT